MVSSMGSMPLEAGVLAAGVLGAGIGGAAAGRSAVVSAGSQGKGHGASQHKGSKFFHYRILLIVVSEATYHRPPFRQTDDCMTSDYSILRLY